MSRGTRILKALAGQGMAEVVSRILPFVILHVVVTRIGAANYGVADFGFRLVDLMLPLVTFGYLHLGTVDLGIAGKEKAESSAIVSEILTLKLLHALIAGVVLVALVYLYPPYAEYRTIALCLSFLIVTTALDMGYVHIGQRRILSAAVIQMLMKAISLVVIIFFVHDGDDTILFAVLYFGANGLISLGTFFHNIRFIELRLPSRAALWRRFRSTLPFAFLSLWGMLLYRYDLFVVEHFGTDDTYGLYSGAQRIAQSVRALLFGLQMVFLAEAVNSNSKSELTRIVHMGLFGGLLFTLPMAAGVWAVDAELLTFVLSDAYASSGLIFSVLMVGTVFQVIVTGFGTQVLLFKKEARVLNTVYPACIVIGIVTAFGLNEFFSIEGVAWSTIVTRVLAAGGVMFYSAKYLDRFPLADYAKLAVSALVMGLVVYFVDLDNLFASLALGGVIYAVLVYVLNRRKILDLLSRAASKFS